MSLSVLLDRVDRALTRTAPLGMSILGISSVYYIAFSYGLGVIALIFGKDGATQVIGNAPVNPLLVLVGVPLIPVGLIALEASDVEARALVLWQENMSPMLSRLPVLGRLIDWLWPTPTRAPLPSSQSGMGGTIDYIARSVSAGLLLPFAAYFVGRFCFKSVESNPKRVILGGLLFFSLKTVIKMYLRHQEFRRQGFRRVLDYNPEWDQ